MNKKIESALISVFYKDGLEPIVRKLNEQGVKLYSTGGTQTFIERMGIQVIPVEEMTGYPSVFGGRVKTLHPAIFGGILQRRELESDQAEAHEFSIPVIDLVIVDLYPFEETVASGAGEKDIIEKIDIGGISLIRAAAKNFKDVLIVSHRGQYGEVETLLNEKGGETTLEDRKKFAVEAFDISSNYDTAIFNHLNGSLSEEAQFQSLKQSDRNVTSLRYGENPHQSGRFYGKLNELFDQLHGKQLSYNNLVDVDGAVRLIDEFPADEGAAFAIIKHTNACGMAMGSDVKDAYVKALACDPVSAFGGILATNVLVDLAAAEEINKLFFEVILAPDFSEEALEVLKKKKNRIILKRKDVELPKVLYRTLLNGVAAMDKDRKMERKEDLKVVTKVAPTDEQIEALLFANKLVKHTKSNTIVLANNNQLFASGVGQTSRVDALEQAIHKAKNFGFDLKNAVMASDAFFPFPDCVEIADKEGIKAVIQPGGSVRDQESIDYCDKNGLAMVTTGTRHFLH